MLIDTHSHLHFKSYDPTREAVHARMAEFGVKTITVGTAMNTSRDGAAYADRHGDTWAAVGFHPDHVTNDYEDDDETGALDEPFSIGELEKIAASSPRVIAIGETGLDYHRLEGEIEEKKQGQRKVFLEHADLAARLDKALIIHMRDAGDDMIAILSDIRTSNPSMRMVMHSFTGSWREASALLDLGCYLGLGGILTFKPRKGTAEADVLANIAGRAPLDRLLLETDAPWLAPVPVRGERNEPSHVRHVADALAKIRGIESEEIARLTTENASVAFKTNFGV